MNTNASTSASLKRLLAAAAVLVAAALFLCVFPAQSHAATRAIGTLSSKYESDDNPADIDSGEAYGAYQMSYGNAKLFALWLQAGYGAKSTSSNYTKYKTWGDSLVTAYKKSTKSFDTYWKSTICGTKDNSDQFFTLQYEFCKKMYYDKSYSFTDAQGSKHSSYGAVYYMGRHCSGFDIANYSTAFQSVVFSLAMQHGAYGAGVYVWENHVLDAVGGWQVGLAEDILINAIYDERSRLSSNGELAYFPGCGRYDDKKTAGYGLYQRLNINERADALALMKKCGGYCSHSTQAGGEKTYTVISDTAHKVKTEALACKSCGAVLRAASTATAKHSFKYSGKKRKCACGKKYVVHSKKKYYAAKTSLNMRSAASSTAGIRATVPKGAVVKVTSAKKDSDGNWWLKTEYNGTAGYVCAKYMSIHGTGSKTHAYSSGTCKYCGFKKKVLTKNTAAGSYKVSAPTSSYVAAYASSAKSADLEKGTVLTITKVVCNCYNCLWGKTSSGDYVDMTALKHL